MKIWHLTSFFPRREEQEKDLEVALIIIEIQDETKELWTMEECQHARHYHIDLEGKGPPHH